MIRDLVSNPCQDACTERSTGRRVDGAPVYVCPGCDSEWYDDRDCVPPTERRDADPNTGRAQHGKAAQSALGDGA